MGAGRRDGRSVGGRRVRRSGTRLRGGRAGVASRQVERQRSRGRGPDSRRDGTGGIVPAAVALSAGTGLLTAGAHFGGGRGLLVAGPRRAIVSVEALSCRVARHRSHWPSGPIRPPHAQRWPSRAMAGRGGALAPPSASRRAIPALPPWLWSQPTAAARWRTGERGKRDRRHRSHRNGCGHIPGGRGDGRLADSAAILAGRLEHQARPDRTVSDRTWSGASGQTLRRSRSLRGNTAATGGGGGYLDRMGDDAYLDGDRAPLWASASAMWTTRSM